MRLLIDIETDSLEPTVIWCAVTKDIDTNETKVWTSADALRNYLDQRIDLIVGHNSIDFDLHWLGVLWDIKVPRERVRDTLVLSRLKDFKVEGGHSLEAWGLRLGLHKQDFKDFSKLTPEMIEYCKQDVEVTHRLWNLLRKFFSANHWHDSVVMEHKLAWICRDMKTNGIQFNIERAKELYSEIESITSALDLEILKGFPPVQKVDREFEVRYKKDGTPTSKTQALLKDPLVKKTGTKLIRYTLEPFNPRSHVQVTERLYGHWDPVEKTTGHLDNKDRKKATHYKKYGWKISEQNLATLRDTAPEAAKLLVQRIMLGARLSQLTTWIEATQNDGRIHPTYNAIGTWTHRLSSVQPNLQNIAAKKTIKYNSDEMRELAIKYGGEFRALFTATPGHFLVGTDMEGAHLRLFAHFINDDKFIQSLVSGNKELGTDPHSLTKSIIGRLCTDRDRAKTFIFTFLNGGGVAKISEVLNCSPEEARMVLERFTNAYPGLRDLKSQVFPEYAKRGYFLGLDGRKIPCESDHLMMAASLQSGEKIIMGHANVLWQNMANHIPYKQINFVHDEFLCECPTEELAHELGRIQSEAIRLTGERFKLNCPLAGEYKVGTNWLEVH